jgi:hypothetical protein
MIKWPAGVDRRLQLLLDRRDQGIAVSADEQLEADGLVELLMPFVAHRITQSRRAYEGCEAKTWDSWRTAVGKLSAKTFEGMHEGRDHTFLDLGLEALIKNRDVFLASAALAICKDRDAPHVRPEHQEANGVRAVSRDQSGVALRPGRPNHLSV